MPCHQWQTGVECFTGARSGRRIFRILLSRMRLREASGDRLKQVNLYYFRRLVELLKQDDRPDLQFETAWALTNIASGNSEQTDCVVKAGSCDHFIRLLSSPAINVAEQAVWALANIAGEGPTYRDMIIDLGVVPALTRLVTPTASTSFLANVAWCLSNLCRNKNPPPSIAAVQACLPSVKQLLLNDSPSVVSDACWSLSYISDGDNDRIQLVCAPTSQTMVTVSHVFSWISSLRHEVIEHSLCRC